jgi:hypothetical protein
MPMDEQVRWLLEQWDAAVEMIHTYRCFYCQMATAERPLMIIQDDPPNARVTIVGICDTCGGEDAIHSGTTKQ